MISAVNCRPLNGFLLFCFTANPLPPHARQSPGKETFKAATEPLGAIVAGVVAMKQMDGML
jgi:hypothetical protein